MAGAKELHANIVLGGKVADSFWELSNAIGTLGSLLVDIGTASFDFLKECTEKYADFEDVMMDAQNAYKATYEGSIQEFNAGMEAMFDSAYEWSANSRFELMDVANAIASTAHAGKTMEETAGYMEAAMNLSLVGSMDLTSGLDMLIKTSNAFGLSFEEAVDFVDMWTFAANSAATDANEMGQAMEKLGGTMRMSTPSEVLTLLGVLANMGTTGTEAGSMLKTTMLRIIAPTNSANEALAELEVTSDELSEAIGDDMEALAGAQEILSSVGFSAYDDEGKLKSFITIYEDLYRALYAVDEEGAQLLTDAERNSLLNTVFGTRGFVGISNIMAGLRENENYLSEANESIENSLGYAADAAETRTNDLKGKMTELENKIEVIKTRIGENVAPELSKVIDLFDGILGKIAELDDSKLNIFVTALEGLSIGAGVFIGMGAIAKGLALIATPAGYVAAAAVGLATFVAVINEISKSDFNDNFGTLTLDNTIMQAQLNAISNSYTTASQEMITFKANLEAAVEAYTTASGQLGGTLHALLIADATLTEEDVGIITSYANAVIDEMNNAINSRTELDMATLNNSLANGEWDTSQIGLFSNLQYALALGYNQLINDAQTQSQNLRNALTSAFADGQLTGEEVENIMAIVNEINSITGGVSVNKLEAKQKALLESGTKLSWEDALTYMQQAGELEEDAITEMWEEYLYPISTFESYAEKARQNGGYWGVDENGNPLSAKYWEEMATYTEELARNAIAQEKAKNDEFMFNLLDAVIADSSFSDVVDNYAYSGSVIGGFLSGKAKDYSKLLTDFIDNMGGIDSLVEQMVYYGESGNTEMANKYKSLIDAYGELSGYTYTPWEMGYTTDQGMSYESRQLYNDYVETVPIEVDSSTLEAARIAIEKTVGQIVNIPVVLQGYKNAADTAWSYIKRKFSQTLSVNVNANVNKSVNTNYLVGLGGDASGYAEGGRATQASIFGEAGAEWAIPEQHTNRTRDLLISAAQASGFSWGELISARGGLGAGGNHTEVVYSPTIVTNDASGMKKALADDKARFEKWWRERNTREEVGAYE